MDCYYVAAFKPSSDEPDLSALKKIVIAEKKNTYCYRYNNLILNVYFQTEPSLPFQNIFWKTVVRSPVL